MASLAGPARDAGTTIAGFAPDTSDAFSGVIAIVDVPVPYGRYRIHYESPGDYAITGLSSWIPDSSGTYSYVRTGPDTAEMVFADSENGEVRCALTYTAEKNGASACTYPNRVTLRSTFSAQ